MLEHPDYLILSAGGQGEYEEKKSKFIATLRPVSSEEEAVAFLAEMKKQYWDARHNCSAFVIGAGGELTRCSDDGEPSGTAGRPMLETLLGSGVRNAAVVVTRYFGGVLLGTGGLVRAYTKAVQAGLENSVITRMIYGGTLDLETDYNDVGKVLFVLRSGGMEPLDSEYGEKIRFQVQVPAQLRGKLEKELMDGTAGRIIMTEIEQGYYPVKE